MGSEQAGVVIIGGGQAGLALSYCLTRKNRKHIVLEQGRIGESWRSRVWDSFTLVTPNWTVQLPGLSYSGTDPDGFMLRDDVVRHLENYANLFHAPLRLGVKVTSLRKNRSDNGFVLETNNGVIETRVVCVATGAYQRPRIPSCSSAFPSEILQLHSSEYRNPSALPPGNVLVVGSGQSGAQIAEELNENGRKVYLSVSKCGRIPRRYRGQAYNKAFVGLMEMTPDKLPPFVKKFGCNPHVSGKNGGHDINLRQLSRNGVVLLGHIQDVREGELGLAGDLQENLNFADQFAAQMKKGVDDFISQAGIEAPPDSNPDDPSLRDWPRGDPILSLDLKGAGITSVIWATGYKYDFSWIQIPVTDETGYPIHQRGVTSYQGLYFVGLQWQFKAKSSLLYGVGEDADFIASHITKQQEASPAV
jgi:putative flavoprotein involved in K+ transport